MIRIAFVLAVTLVAVSSVLAASAELPKEPSFWDSFFSYWQEGGQNTSRSEVLRNVGLLVVGIIGLGFGIWRAYTAYRQISIAEQGHFTERFSVAVGHLGNEMLPVRLGGIYALWRLAEDSPKRDLTKVLDILCAYVRNPPHSAIGESLTETVPLGENNETQGALIPISTPAAAPDVQIILNLITKFGTPFRSVLNYSYHLDLHGADLGGANLKNANLDGADLTEAVLNATDLESADLIEADLRRAEFNGANLYGANLRNATLAGVDLSQANLEEANLESANFRRVTLEGANLTRVNLKYADFAGANLRDVNFFGADFGEVNIGNADIQGASFVSVENLTQDQLNAACIGDFGLPPTFPDGLNPPTRKCGDKTRK